MHIEHENKKKIYLLEIIKWISAIGLMIAAIVGNYLYRYHHVFIRIMIVSGIVLVAMYIASITKIGKLVVMFGHESRAELRQVVWPTYREGLNTTLIVIVVTIIMSLLLWGLDTILVHIISFGLRL